MIILCKFNAIKHHYGQSHSRNSQLYSSSGAHPAHLCIDTPKIRDKKVYSPNSMNKINY